MPHNPLGKMEHVVGGLVIPICILLIVIINLLTWTVFVPSGAGLGGTTIAPPLLSSRTPVVLGVVLAKFAVALFGFFFFWLSRYRDDHAFEWIGIGCGIALLLVGVITACF